MSWNASRVSCRTTRRCWLTSTAETNARCATTFVEVLGQIHAVDIDRVGLGGFAKREGYLERQVIRWTDQWARSKSADQPEVDALAARLQRTMPVQRETTLVHGDYRLGNVMLDASDTAASSPCSTGRWRRSAIRSPISRTPCCGGGPATARLRIPARPWPTCPGFLSVPDLIECYAATTGRTCATIGWYVAMAAFKLTVIGEGQRARLRRTGADVDATTAQPLASWALAASDPGGPFAIS